VQRQAFADDAADRHPRAERAERILEYDLDPPTHRAQRLAAGVVDPRAVEHDLAGGDRLQREQREAERRLARARLADDAERLAATKPQRRVANGQEVAGREPARAGREVDRDRPPLDQRRRVGGEWLDDAPRPAGEELLRVGVARIVPVILFSLVGGAIADSFDRRKIMFITQSSASLLALALGLLTQFGQITIWLIYALTALQAITVAFDGQQ
jgi:hypothetical protein